MEIRKVYAPYSKTGEQVGQTPLEGYVEVNQAVYPAVNTGLINENGEWIGLKSSEKDFHSFGKDEAIANGASILAPQIASGTKWPLDMTGFTGLFIAIKPTNAGDCRIEAVMGPNDLSFANLQPINPASVLRGNTNAWNGNSLSEIGNLILDTADTLAADVWNIFLIQNRLNNQKLLQFKITNNSGGESTIETAFMRLV